MKTFTAKKQENQAESAAHSIIQRKKARKGVALVDNRSEPIQKKANNTGLPDNLKSGVENLSGYALDDVKVYYNSSKPAQLNAHAYAQGSHIHIAPGQEKHLPHETWHVVQQKQGRVQPTRQLKGKVQINDDAALEKEADVMGAMAIQLRVSTLTGNKKPTLSKASDPLLTLQRVHNGEVIQLGITDYLKAGVFEGQPIMHGIGLLGTAASFAYKSTIGHAVSATFHGLGAVHAIAKLVWDLYYKDGSEASKKKIARDIVNLLTGLGLTAGDIVALFHPIVGLVISTASNAARGVYPVKDLVTDDAGDDKKMVAGGNAAMNILISPLVVIGATLSKAPALSLLNIVTAMTNFLQGFYNTKKAVEEGTYKGRRPGYNQIA